MTIEGLEHLEKDGWELVRVGRIHPGEHWVNGQGCVQEFCDVKPSHSLGYAIIRKIEKPKQYRPFANAAEFAPHRDRWITHPVGTQCEGAFQVTEYDNKGIRANGIAQRMLYETAYSIGLRFENLDGTTEPFGVEVQS